MNKVLPKITNFETVLDIIKKEHSMKFKLRCILDLATTHKKWINTPTCKYDTKHITPHKILFNHYNKKKIYPELNDSFFVSLTEYFLFIIKYKYPSVVIKLQYSNVSRTNVFKSNIVDLEERLDEIFKEIAI